MAEAKLERNREIYEARERGASFSELGREYGVTSSCITRSNFSL